MLTSDTVEHDILPFAGGDEVAVYNLCTDTTRHMNGVVTNMHPSEGVWLFRYVLDPQHAPVRVCLAIQVQPSTPCSTPGRSRPS